MEMNHEQLQKELTRLMNEATEDLGAPSVDLGRIHGNRRRRRLAIIGAAAVLSAGVGVGSAAALGGFAKGPVPKPACAPAEQPKVPGRSAVYGQPLPAKGPGGQAAIAKC